MARKVVVLGSTGSIGVSTLSLFEESRAEVEVLALTAGRNVALLAQQARRWKPLRAVIADESLLDALRQALDGTGVEAAAGEQAVVEAASMGADWVMAAIVGAAGLAPTLAAAKSGCVLALANKESLVCAGPALLAAAQRAGGRVIPVDSEHSAIFQVLEPGNAHRVSKLILTASGGPFRAWTAAAMAAATPTQAVAHPNWNMGAKISVDSATMMNKALEVIEARYLFGLDPSQIEVVIHPQSVIHSMVQYRDRSVVAQLGTPDMRVPIAYGLSWPERMDSGASALDFASLGALTFERPDDARFPGLRLAWAALEGPAGTTAVLNAANEVAVAAFLAGRLRFDRIHTVNSATLEALVPSKPEGLAALLDLDARARAQAEVWVSRCSG